MAKGQLIMIAGPACPMKTIVRKQLALHFLYATAPGSNPIGVVDGVLGEDRAYAIDIQRAVRKGQTAVVEVHHDPDYLWLEPDYIVTIEARARR